jgi:hypothetical protein
MRSRKSICCLVFLLIFPSIGFGQQHLAGRITKKRATEILIGVNITNFTQKKINVSDMGGNYKIPAAPGDTIIFSSAGYRSDTLIVAAFMLSDLYPVRLVPNIMALTAVRVDEMHDYQLDSLQRRDDYKELLNKKHPVKLWNEKRPVDGPGFSFSPAGYLSKTEKQKRRLKKRLEWEEEEYYIDYKFSPSRVVQLTRLKGDSLQIFMLRYRPSYKFCRKASGQDMMFYVNDKLKLFRKS